jgi:hypothetical protein
MDFGCEEIYCISLVDSTDKRKYFSDLMKELNIPFKFFDAFVPALRSSLMLTRITHRD